MAITTYTPSQGNTPQGVGQFNLNDTLSSLQRTVPNPQDISGTLQGMKNQSPIPQMAGDQNKIAQMYLADQNLAGKFTNPSLNTPTPQAQPGQTISQMDPSMLPAKMTPQNINDPFQGFNDPNTASSAAGSQVTSAMSTLKAISDLIGTDYDVLGKQLDQVGTAYKAKLDAKQKAQDNILNLYEFLQSEHDKLILANSPSTKQGQLLYANKLKVEVQKGGKLKDLMSEYGTILDSDTILQIYNQNSPYGPAKESRDQLASLNVSKSALDTMRPIKGTKVVSKSSGWGPWATTEQWIADKQTSTPIRRLFNENGVATLTDPTTGQTYQFDRSDPQQAAEIQMALDQGYQ